MCQHCYPFMHCHLVEIERCGGPLLTQSEFLYVASNQFFNWTNPGLFNVYFRRFQMIKFKYKFIIASMVCLGLKRGAVGWKVLMSNGVTPKRL